MSKKLEMNKRLWSLILALSLVLNIFIGTVGYAETPDENVIPLVTINGQVITGTDGTYKTTLTVGDNTITIQATDLAGNKSDLAYKIIYEQK